jgi:hypothetical protein
MKFTERELELLSDGILQLIGNANSMEKALNASAPENARKEIEAYRDELNALKGKIFVGMNDEVIVWENILPVVLALGRHGFTEIGMESGNWGYTLTAKHEDWWIGFEKTVEFKVTFIEETAGGLIKALENEAFGALGGSAKTDLSNAIEDAKKDLKLMEVYDFR